jgi:hypothetical protein
MNIVKFYIDPDGNKINNPKWCVVSDVGRTDSSDLCGGTPLCDFDDYDLKDGKLKDVTCPKCLDTVKWFKSLK